MTRPTEVTPTPAHRIGLRLERRARRELEAAGWVVVRSWMSRTAVDLMAARTGSVLLIQSRTGLYLIPAERLQLLEAARRAGADALVVGTAADGTLTWYRLTGPGGSDREPWEV